MMFMLMMVMMMKLEQVPKPGFRAPAPRGPGAPEP